MQSHTFWLFNIRFRFPTLSIELNVIYFQKNKKYVQFYEQTNGDKITWKPVENSYRMNENESKDFLNCKKEKRDKKNENINPTKIIIFMQGGAIMTATTLQWDHGRISRSTLPPRMLVFVFIPYQNPAPHDDNADDDYEERNATDFFGYLFHLFYCYYFYVAIFTYTPSA